NAAVLITDHDVTVTHAGGGDYFFDLTTDGTNDYRLAYGDNNARKPRIAADPFSGEEKRVMLPYVEVNGDPSTTLPVISPGATIDGNLFAGHSLREGFFFLNFEQDYYGDWGG